MFSLNFVVDEGSTSRNNSVGYQQNTSPRVLSRIDFQESSLIFVLNEGSTSRNSEIRAILLFLYCARFQQYRLPKVLTNLRFELKGRLQAITNKLATLYVLLLKVFKSKVLKSLTLVTFELIYVSIESEKLKVL